MYNRLFLSGGVLNLGMVGTLAMSIHLWTEYWSGVVFEQGLSAFVTDIVTDC